MRTGGRIGRGLLMGLVAIIVFVVSNNPALGLTGTQSMPTARGDLAVGVVDNILYAVGGFGEFNYDSALNTVEAYDLGTNTWTAKAPMPTARGDLGVGVVFNILYAVGGGNSTSVLNTVEIYDSNIDTWPRIH